MTQRRRGDGFRGGMTFLAILGIMAFGAALPTFVESVRAQFIAQQTWIPAAGIGGTGSAITLTVPNASQYADLLGVPIRLIPTGTNVAGGTTVNVNSFGAKNVMRAAATGLVALAGGDFVTGSQVDIVYDGTEFVLQIPVSGLIPVGMIADFSGPTAPTGWLIGNGSCISQTTYAALWAYYGSANVWSPGSAVCAGGQFNLPYFNGRATVAYDTQGSVTASVLTNGGSGCAATGVAVQCGAQNRTIAQGNIPNYNLSIGSLTVVQSQGPLVRNNSLQTVQNGGGASVPGLIQSDGTTDAFSIGGTLPSGGSGTALATVQPVSTVIKAVKY